MTRLVSIRSLAMILLGQVVAIILIAAVGVSIRSLAMILLGQPRLRPRPWFPMQVSIRSLAMILLGRHRRRNSVSDTRFQFALWR